MLEKYNGDDMEKKSADKIRTTLMAIVALAVLTSAILKFLTGIDGSFVLTVIMIALIGIQVIIVYIVLKKRNDVMNGYPLEDERSKRVMDKASSRTFYFMIYFILFLGWISDDGIESIGIEPIIGRYVALIALMGGVLFFIAMMGVYSYKADV